MPLTKPRRATGICGGMLVATNTMMAPPARPERKPPDKEPCMTETGKAQAKKAAVAATISRRSA